MRMSELTTETQKSLTPFWQMNVLNAIFYSLLITSFVFFAFYPWKANIASYMRQSSGPFIFFPVFATAAIIYTYLSLRCGRGEFAIGNAYVESYNEQTPPLVYAEETRQVFRYALPMFLLHTLFLLLPALPIFLLATALAGLPFSSCWLGLSIIFATAFCARWIGFFLLLLLGRSSMFAYFASRIAIALLLFAMILTSSTYNSLRSLYDLHLSPSISIFSWNNAALQYIMLITGIAALFAMLCQWQQTRRQHQSAKQQQPISRRKRSLRG